MNRAAILAVLAACSSQPPRAPITPAIGPATPVQIAPSPPTSSAVVGFAARTRVIESRHASEIKTLAATPDGTAVLSVDEIGGTRLWPVLDGTVEPRVVDLPAATAVALAPDPRGFIAAAIDDVGGMTIAVIDRDGLVQQRASVPAEPAFVHVVSTSRGLLATRVDQSIVRLSADGGIVERIAAAGGQRIAGLAARGDKLVVQIENDRRRLRWLLVAPALQWGDWIETKVEPEGVIAVSPKGTTTALAVGAPAQRRLVVIENATGAVIDGESLAGTVAFDIAYADEDHIVVGPRGATRVHAIDRKNTKAERPTPAPTELESRTLVAGGERVIGTASAELAIIDRAGKSYLGYDIEAPTVAAPAPGGALLIGVGTQFVQLDKTLAAVATPDFRLPELGSVAELRHIEGDAWLVEWASLDTGWTMAAFIDLATHARTDLHNEREAAQAIGYDPGSRLATFALGESADVLRYDPRAKKFKRIAEIKAATGRAFSQTALTPLAPALAGGNELLVTTISDRLTLRWVPDARSPDKGVSIELDGTFAAADATGNAYVWQRDGDGVATVIWRNAKQVAKLRTDHTVGIAPDPAGKRYIEMSRNEVALVTHDNVRAWVLPIVGVNEVQWLSDGAVALLGTGGVARVDVATGTVQAARCGWRFGLAKTQHRASSRVEPMCTQLR